MIAIRKKILVAVDGSDQSLEAVRYVSKVLPAGQVNVVVFHVMAKIPESFLDLKGFSPLQQHISSVGAWQMQQEKVMGLFMRKAREILSASGFPDDMVETRIQEKKTGIARDITAESQAGYDAVVMGRTGTGALVELILGSIATKIIGKVDHAPVWVVGGEPSADKILVAVDGSEGSMHAVDYVGRMLGGSGPAVTLMNVIRSLDLFGSQAGAPGYSEQEKDLQDVGRLQLRKMKEEMMVVLDEAKRRLVAAGGNPERIDTRIITDVSSRAGVIVELARKEGYGTIVVGRRGLSKVQEFFMGRVSNKVIQMAREMAVWVVS